MKIIIIFAELRVLQKKTDCLSIEKHCSVSAKLEKCVNCAYKMLIHTVSQKCKPQTFIRIFAKYFKFFHRDILLGNF